VDPGPHATTITGDREFALAHGLNQLVVGFAVEAAVALRDAAGSGDGPVEVVHGCFAFAHRRRRTCVERIVFRLDWTTLTGIAVVGVALRHESTHSCVSGGREQIIRPLSAEPIRLSEAAVEVLEVA
jgi:hypothetical protein